MKLENNIKISGSRGAKPKTPILKFLRTMEVGQSFLTESKQAAYAQVQSVLIGKELGRKFITRMEDCGGRRVWRVK